MVVSLLCQANTFELMSFSVVVKSLDFKKALQVSKPKKKANDFHFISLTFISFHPSTPLLWNSYYFDPILQFIF